MEEYQSYDDEGVYTEGSITECMDSIVNWCQSDEAETVYIENELIEIIRVFSSHWTSDKLKETGYIEYSGFSIKRL